MEFGRKISESIHKKIFTLITYLIHNPIHGVVNIHPGYSSILLTLDKMANIDDTIRLVENIFDVDFTGPTAIIMGSEEDGISPAYLNLCDRIAKIPMYGTVQSLNVSVSAGILMYEHKRQSNV